MKALSWTIDKAPAFSNAKFLVIGLPPCLHQASVFDANAYPPMYGIGAQPHTEMNSLPDYHARGYQSQDPEKEAWYVPPQAIAEQKVHVASGDDLPQTASDQLQRINSARHSLPPVRRDSLTSNHNYESSDDAVSIAYGANGGNRRASDAASIHSVGSRRGSVANDNSALSGLTRPERSSSKSSRMSGRIL